MSLHAVNWWYNVTRRTYILACMAIPIVYRSFDAPFGKFASVPSRWTKSWTVNTNAAWFVMEIFAPATLIWTFISAPLSEIGTPPPLKSPAGLLAALFVFHYVHRAIIQPLRTPKRTPSHVMVPIAAVLYNIINGGLLGSYLSSGEVAMDGWDKPAFWASVVLFFAGMAGNIYHDELLARLRRATKGDGKPRYAIPQGGLFSLVSYPNYFCEWCEWTGFALASSIGAKFPTYVTPPWLFVLGEVLVMLPRAINGHRWNKEKFEDYPKERKAAIPFLL